VPDALGPIGVTIQGLSLTAPGDAISDATFAGLGETVGVGGFAPLAALPLRSGRVVPEWVFWVFWGLTLLPVFSGTAAGFTTWRTRWPTETPRTVPVFMSARVSWEGREGVPQPWAEPSPHSASQISVICPYERSDSI
jgi:hypothetical protein